MADLVGPCDDCGRIYNKSSLQSCPVCTPARAVPGKSKIVREFSDVDIVMAANRTTRAVRAIYNLIALVIVSGLITAVWFGLGMAGNMLATIFMGLIQLAAIVLFFIRAESEYAKSYRMSYPEVARLHGIDDKAA